MSVCLTCIFWGRLPCRERCRGSRSKDREGSSCWSRRYSWSRRSRLWGACWTSSFSVMTCSSLASWEERESLVVPGSAAVGHCPVMARGGQETGAWSGDVIVRGWSRQGGWWSWWQGIGRGWTPFSIPTAQSPLTSARLWSVQCYQTRLGRSDKELSMDKHLSGIPWG